MKVLIRNGSAARCRGLANRCTPAWIQLDAAAQLQLSCADCIQKAQEELFEFRRRIEHLPFQNEQDLRQREIRWAAGRGVWRAVSAASVEFADHGPGCND
ncbi:MAG UNVERIFIED_CONTAM: hypothetical protein LVR18_49375 [Planctomycetaceae bacterium]